jgi:hypothetical protein
MATNLTEQSSFISRLYAWLNERFPLGHGVLFLAIYAASLLLGRFLSNPGPLVLGAPHVGGFFGIWAFFLMLRVFDEHKDYALDCHNHPDRVLQRGLITLTHLKGVGAVAIAIQLGASLWIDRGVGIVTLTWLVVMVWSSLMAVEFFCGAWLERRLILYAFSHMLVMPLALLWMTQMGGTGACVAAESQVWMLAALAFVSGAAFEITRKTRGPEEERDTVDSYTKVLGTTVAPVIIMVFLAVGAALELFLLCWIRGGSLTWPWYLAVGLALGLALVSLGRFIGSPSEKGRKVNEAVVSLSMLAAYIVLTVALVTTRGVVWG